MVDFHDLREQMITAGIFAKIVPHFYVQENCKLDLRIACSYIIREMLKNNLDLITTFLEDKKAVDSLQEFITSSNIQSVIEGMQIIKRLKYHRRNVL